MSGIEHLDEAHLWVLEDGRHLWFANRQELTVSYLTDQKDLTIWADPIDTMREIGVALVDHTRTMRANARRDRRYYNE